MDVDVAVGCRAEGDGGRIRNPARTAARVTAVARGKDRVKIGSDCDSGDTTFNTGCFAQMFVSAHAVIKLLQQAIQQNPAYRQGFLSLDGLAGNSYAY